MVVSRPNEIDWVMRLVLLRRPYEKLRTRLEVPFAIPTPNSWGLWKDRETKLILLFKTTPKSSIYCSENKNKSRTRYLSKTLHWLVKEIHHTDPKVLQ
jgi:hypothetical protein